MNPEYYNYYNMKIEDYQKEVLDRLEALVYTKPITQETAVADKITFIRLEMTEDGHSKFWEATAKGASNAEAGWGKIGKAPQGTKLYTNEELEKVMKEKIKKGYKVVSMK